MRTPAIFGNWKMNKTPDEAVALAQALKAGLAGTAGPEVAVFPTSVALGAVAGELQDTPVGVGAQNIHYETSGAFTGEISAQMAVAAGARYTLIGHSERRHIFGESDRWVNLKLKAALGAGLVPVVCVGETLQQREDGATRKVVSSQVQAAFEGVDGAQARGVIAAYEPVWAIGTGKTATPELAGEVHAIIRELLTGMFGGETAQAMRIQYGGSAKPANAADLLAQEGVDGLLVGGASLDADSFCRIVAAGAGQAGQ